MSYVLSSPHTVTVSYLTVTVSYLRCIRRGIHDLKVWPGVVADGNVKTTTPGKPENKTISEMIRLTKVVNYSNTMLSKVGMSVAY